jgi:hypothetical protein
MNGKELGHVVVYGIVMVGLGVVMVRVQRAASRPDFGKTTQMWAWRGVKQVADRNSAWWGDLGLKAGTMYNRCRNGI